MTFNDLSLCPQLLKAVEQVGYTTPSPIQAGAIPPLLEGRDLLGCAQTGTGKTAAFALPILQNLSRTQPRRKGAVRALILTPTRELALQIGENFSQYGKYMKLCHTVIFGGVGQQPQVEALKKGVDILVACPGRLNDLAGQGLLSLADIEIFVLDEADRMLDMGFIHDVKKVVARLPRQRQTLLFSATMPAEIEALAASLLHSPAQVKVDPVSSTVERIDQKLYFVEKKQKIQLLSWLLQDPDIHNALVFSRTKHGADRIVRLLTKQGITAAAIHGNKGQNARVAALEGFKKGSVRVLVATDIAARGIDINELSHVFNYDLPEVAETYVHRIGRTARAGADGTAISFCSQEEREYLAGIEKLNRKKIPVINDHPFREAGGQPAADEAAPKCAAPDRKKTVRKEEPPVENEEIRQNAAEGSKGLSASAKRRRRRRRAQDRSQSAAGAEVQAAETAAEKKQQAQPRQNPPRQPQQPKQAKQPKQAQSPARQPQQGKASQGKQTQKQQPAAQKQNQPAKQPAAPKQAQSPKAAQPARAPRGQEPRRQILTSRHKEREEDPGLLLISRKPPAQKFANFEAYMAAHGGETAPIVGESGEE